MENLETFVGWSIRSWSITPRSRMVVDLVDFRPFPQNATVQRKAKIVFLDLISAKIREFTNDLKQDASIERIIVRMNSDAIVQCEIFVNGNGMIASTSHSALVLRSRL